MKKLLVALIGFTGLMPNAAKASYAKMDSVLPGNRDLSETEFMVNYAKDDSSRSLIRYYFIKRGKIEKHFLRPAFAFTAMAMTGFIMDGVAYDRDGSLGSALLEVMAGIGVTLAVVFSSLSVWRLTFYSKKKLLRQLLRYQQDGYVPDDIARSRLYRQLCKGYPGVQHKRPALFRGKKKPVLQPVKN